MRLKFQFPKAYTVVKWLSLAVIAVMTAIVGFFQSMLVAWLYRARSTFIYDIVQLEDVGRVKALQEYVGFNLALALGCSLTLLIVSPAASGSGIPDVKAFLNGIDHPIFKNFFTVKTFIAKVIGSALAVASSLVMGKEGPMLHAGSILAVILGNSKWFKAQMEAAAHWGVYTYNKDLRDLVACGAAAGVCTAFKAPVGGIMFAMEMSTRWRKEMTWRCLFVCAVTSVVVRFSVKTCVDSGHCSFLSWGSLIWFNQSYPTPYQQVWAMVVLAVIGGYLGSLFTTFNTWVCIIRKRWSIRPWARILEIGCISITTSLVLYMLPAAGACMPCQTSEAQHCVAGSATFRTFKGFRCKPKHYNDIAVLSFNPQGFVIQALFTAASGTFSIGTLFLYASVFWLLAAITYGAFLPSGLFTPSLIFGGCLGRIFAEGLVAMGVVHSTHVGMYSLLGAAAFLGGLLRMSASFCLILMEMTNSPNQLPFLMLVLVIAKSVGDRFNYSVFDHQMMLKGLTFIGCQSESLVKKTRMTAQDVMSHRQDSTAVFHLQETVQVVAHALQVHKDVQAFPVVRPLAGGDGNPGEPPCPLSAPPGFVGMIRRKAVEQLLAELGGKEHELVDLAAHVEVAPIVIPPNMPLSFVYAVMSTMGMEYLPVVRQHGPIEGVVTRADLVEAQNHTLDQFHIQDKIDELTHEVKDGNLIKTLNTGRKMFSGYATTPLLAAQSLLTGEHFRERQHLGTVQEGEEEEEAGGGDVGGAIYATPYRRSDYV